MRVYTNVYYDVMALAVVNDVSKIDLTSSGGSNASAMNKFTKNSFHVLTNNVNKDLEKYDDTLMMEGEEKEEETTEDSDDDNDGLAEDIFFSNSKKFAHVRYERRNTVDVLSKTPPRKSRALEV